MIMITIDDNDDHSGVGVDEVTMMTTTMMMIIKMMFTTTTMW